MPEGTVPIPTASSRPSGLGASLLLFLACTAGPVFAQGTLSPPPRLADSAAPPPLARGQAVGETRILTKGTHIRVTFEKDVARVAVGDPEALTSEILSSRELLVLGQDIGRTSLIVWFDDGTFKEFTYVVEADLSVLREALKDVHPSIEAVMAPDRNAVVLRGTVPDITYSIAAEEVATRYLGANRGAAEASLIGVGGEGASQLEPGQPEGGGIQTAGSVINLLKLEHLPPGPEERIVEAIAGVGGADVTVRRIIKDSMADDEKDVLVLEGTVANQVALLRVLTVAAQVFSGDADALSDIKVIGDESGALAGQEATSQAQNSGGLGGSGSVAGLGGGGSARSLINRIESNLARAKAIELAGGRILSFIKVLDIPQVRVQIALYQINRTRLRNFGSDLLASGANFNLTNRPGFLPGGGNVAADVVESLSGNFSNEFLFATDRFTLDSILSLLESRDIARALSKPSLMVLSGEVAFFQVGGQVPIPVNFSPAFGGDSSANPGVFNSVQFAEFGIQLGVRPLVDENDRITLDVIPQVVNPDVGLTEVIRNSTGTDPATLAFETRSLQTSARLEDGQSLLIGGLINSKLSDGETETPGVSNVPILGQMFGGFTRSNDELELVILVNPVIVREKIRDTALWAFPGGPELMVNAGIMQPPPAAEPRPVLE